MSLPTPIPSASEKTVTADPLVGQTLGDFVVMERVAHGGMALVYRGEQPTIGKRVAIKVLSPELATDAEMVARMVDEARTLSRIRHPNLISVYSAGQLPDGRAYYVMELLNGQTLAERMATHPVLPTGEAVAIAEQICEGLQAAHEAQVVHRDLKPANIFLDVLPDDTWRVKVLDFGIAKRPYSDIRTATNVVLGTPGYMAPEQIRGKKVTSATDLYALGVVLWRMLTGQELFHAPTPLDVLRMHLSSEVPKVEELAPRLPPELIALLTDLLHKEPEKRPPSAAAVKQRLSQIRRALPAYTTGQLARMTAVTQIPAAAAERAPDTIRSQPQVPIATQPTRRVPAVALLAVGVLAGVVSTGVAVRWLGNASQGSDKPAPSPLSSAPPETGSLRGTPPSSDTRSRGSEEAQPTTGQPTTGQPATGQPATDQPMTGQPATGQPATGQPATDQPTTGQPTTGQPTTGQPTTAAGAKPKPVTPPEGRGPRVNRAKEEARLRLDRLRKRGESLPSGAMRQMFERELTGLIDRLEAGEKPSVVLIQADKLAKESGL